MRHDQATKDVVIRPGERGTIVVKIPHDAINITCVTYAADLHDGYTPGRTPQQFHWEADTDEFIDGERVLGLGYWNAAQDRARKARCLVVFLRPQQTQAL